MWITQNTDHGRWIIVEDGGHVLPGEGVCGVGDEHARLPHGAVSHNHAFDGAARWHHATRSGPADFNNWVLLKWTLCHFAFTLVFFVSLVWFLFLILTGSGNNSRSSTSLAE